MDTQDRSRLIDFSQILDYLLPALVVTLGMQTLRTLIPGVAWYLRDTLGVGTLQLIPYALGPFLLGFFAAAFRKVVGPRPSLWISAGGLGVIRLFIQFNSNASAHFWSSVVGVGLFTIFIPIFIGHVRAQGEVGAGRWAYGLVLGLAFDIALRGLFGAVNLSMLSGALPDAVLVLLILVVFWALWREPSTGMATSNETTWRRALPLMAFGPYLVLQTLLFGSQGYLEVVAGFSSSLGYLLVMLGYLAACAGLAWGFARPRTLNPALAFIIAAALALAGYGADQSGAWILVMTLLGQGFMGWGWALVALVNEEGRERGLWRTTVCAGGGMLLFLILVFAYYVAQDMALPFPRGALPATAGALAGLFFLSASLQARTMPEVQTRNLTGLVAAGILVLAPVIYWVAVGPGPKAIQPSDGQVKVMTFNIHSAFNSFGTQDLETIAQVIEESGAEIVALQEVSRTRFMDGYLDMPVWLSRRLDMPYLFQGTEEPIWGNAILSRYPVLESGWGTLPRVGTLIGRGYLWARIDAGGPEPLLVIATHLHQLGPDSRERQEQVATLSEFWDDRNHTILLGDMNAEPGSPEMEMLSDEGLLDAWRGAGAGPGYTFSFSDPVKRIDWLWHTKDLTPVQIEVIQTSASDHMPVLATFKLAP